MLMTDSGIDGLRRAYQLLGIPYSASERSIKQAYRRMTKRWHPDRYTSGTPAHAEATQMMKRINEAYSQIANAPLRGYEEQTARLQRQMGSEADRSADANADKPYVHNPYIGSPHANDPYGADPAMRPGRLSRRIGACFRFVAGGVFGVYVLWLFYVSLRLADHPVLAVVLIIGGFLGGGFTMLLYGSNLRWGRW